MTREKILELLNKYYTMRIKKYVNSDDDFSDELLALIEQEKKEVAKDIFAKIFNPYYMHTNEECRDLGEYCGTGWIHSVYEAQEIAKEYGVEL